MKDNRFLKRLHKKAKNGLRGWPLATIALYGHGKKPAEIDCQNAINLKGFLTGFRQGRRRGEIQCRVVRGAARRAGLPAGGQSYMMLMAAFRASG
jgi:hypothetical protein